MLILISPAKTLDFETAPPACVAAEKAGEPALLDASAVLIDKLRKMSPRRLSRLMGISPALAELNAARYRTWQGRLAQASAKPAMFAFDGDVYQGLDARSLSCAQIRRAQRQVRILSGLYGVLKPLDRIEPHRLEMGTALAVGRAKNLCGYWATSVTEALNRELTGDRQPVVVNLASQEYFGVVSVEALRAPVITPVFEEWRDGRYKVVSFFAKRARGLMARYAITRGLRDPQELMAFDSAGYQFAPEASSESVWYFRRDRRQDDDSNQ